MANIDNGEINGVIFLDLKKAFDLVNHIILLKKLEYYNVSNCTLDWFKSYLFERSQQVKVNNVMSNTKCIKTGVPQGSILGPLLFILYINDLPLNIEHSLIDLYADDSTLHCRGNDVIQIASNLQNDIHVIENWCLQNCMKLNAKKCKSMIIGSKQRLCLTGNSLDINISNEQIENVDCEKLLGLYIDKNLNWNQQIDKMSITISNRINLLQKIRKYLPMHIRIIYFNAYILPLFDYCCNIWGSCCESGINKLNKLLKKSARVIVEADIMTSSSLLFKSLHWLNVEKRIQYQKAILVFKSVNGMVPNYLEENFHFTNNQNYNLRSADEKLLNLPKPKTNFLKKTFTYSGSQIWNSLPNEIKMSNTLVSFKTKCYKFFINCAN